MARFLSWIRRVPVWVWIFLVVTQILNVLADTARIIRFNRILTDLPEDSLNADLRKGYHAMLWDNQVSLAVSCMAFFLFGTMAYVRLRDRRAARRARAS